MKLKINIEKRLSLRYDLKDVKLEQRLNQLFIVIKINKNSAEDVSIEDINKKVSLADVFSGRTDNETINQDQTENKTNKLKESVTALVKEALVDTIKNLSRT